MQRFRAAFALLFHVLLLQATVLGGGMACAPEWLSAVARSSHDATTQVDAHDGGAPATAHAHAEHGAHAPDASVAGHASHGGERAVASEPAPSPAHAPEHGGVPTHCATAAGCAAVAVAAPALASTGVAVIDDAVRGGPDALPPSTRQAPEPPPPRA